MKSFLVRLAVRRAKKRLALGIGVLGLGFLIVLAKDYIWLLLVAFLVLKQLREIWKEYRILKIDITMLFLADVNHCTDLLVSTTRNAFGYHFAFLELENACIRFLGGGLERSQIDEALGLMPNFPSRLKRGRIRECFVSDLEYNASRAKDALSRRDYDNVVVLKLNGAVIRALYYGYSLKKIRSFIANALGVPETSVRVSFRITSFHDVSLETLSRFRGNVIII